MIDKLCLENFKCFEQIEIPLRKLNILTGINGMGKSTVLQSLLLLKQSAGQLALNGTLALNGHLLQLGIGRDLLCESAEDDSQIGIRVQEQNKVIEFLFKYEPFSDELSLKEQVSDFPEFVQRGKSVYLSAYRIEPEKIYGITNEEALKNREFSSSGLYALQYLKEYGPKPAPIDGEENVTLYEQVQKWMNWIAPGISVQVEVDIEKQLATLGYSFVEGKNRTNTYSCVNVGFGITYVLPILVALLSAKPGDLIMLENPEAHIHPAGQRKLGELLAVAANNGVQLIVETHSDHILNGVRIAVKNKVLPKDEANLLYFYKDAEDGFRHKYETPHITMDGRIDKWPRGFFDEWDNALLELL